MIEPGIHILPEYYSEVYKRQKHDSPERSRIALIAKMAECLKSGIPNNNILNIGSGPQSLERQLFSRGQAFIDEFRFWTIDVAEITRKKLLAIEKENVFHARGNALKLPYKSGAFGLVVSNHAIDFLPTEVFGEVNRVLAPHGSVYLNFHHPTMIPEDLRKVKHQPIRDFWGYLRENKVLFDSEERIVITMASFGFTTCSLALNGDGIDRWWEVELKKSHNA